MTDKVSAPAIRAMKGREQRIVCVTAYDVNTAQLADEAGVDLVLVGDSLGNVLLGFETTIPVSLDDMIHHTKAARVGVKRALLITDMPFGSYEASPEQAVDSAVALMKAGAEGVKLEGDYVEAIEAITRAGIPVMGHVGMTPQSVNRFGGFRVQGKGESGEQVIRQARDVDEAGAFAMVLELIPAALAQAITAAACCPTIGIGAGPHCDGQIQVFHDVLGLTRQPLKHVKRYAEVAEECLRGLKAYTDEVRRGIFPEDKHSF
jgi:3-methyl-2-oxobutanoate hydroxymethyltransferase